MTNKSVNISDVDDQCYPILMLEPEPYWVTVGRAHQGLTDEPPTRTGSGGTVSAAAAHKRVVTQLRIQINK